MFGYGPFYGNGYGPYGVGGFGGYGGYGDSWGCCTPGYGVFCRNRYNRGFGYGYPNQNYYAGFNQFSPYGYY